MESVVVVVRLVGNLDSLISRCSIILSAYTRTQALLTLLSSTSRVIEDLILSTYFFIPWVRL